VPLVQRAFGLVGREPTRRFPGDDELSDHIALISADREHHNRTAFRFVRDGLGCDEQVLYIAGDRPRERVLETMRDHDIDVDRHVESDALSVRTVDGAPGETPLHETVLGHIEQATDVPEEHDALRVVTEVSRIFEGSADEIAAYEQRLATICDRPDVMALCGYLRGQTPPDLLRDAIRAHPFVVSGDSISRNVFFTPPGEVWGDESPNRAIDRMLSRLQNTSSSDDFGPSESQSPLALPAGDLWFWEFDHQRDRLSLTSMHDESLVEHSGSGDGVPFERFLQCVHPADRDAVEQRMRRPTAGEDWAFECRFRRPDGTYHWVAVEGARPTDRDGEPQRSVGVLCDRTDQKQLERELRVEREHFRVALENSPFTAFRLDTDLRYTWIGTPHSDFDASSVLGKRDDELLPPEAAETIMAPKREVLETGEGVRREVTYELSSGRVTYDLTVEPLRDDDGDIVGLTAAALDITDQKALERTLSRLHEASRDLIRATSKAEASQQTVDAAVAALDVEGVALYLFDDDNRLRPTAATPWLSETCGELSPVGPSTPSPAWQAFITNETVRRADLTDDADELTADTPVRNGLWIPVGDHGVLAILSATDGELADRVQRAADHLAATAQATMDRIEHEESIGAQERELAEQNRRLEHLSRINDIIREIDQALIQATTTAGIEEAVCDRLTRDDRFRFAWIGERTADTVTPRVRAGSESDYLDEIPLRTDTEGGDPATVTAATGAVTLVTNVADNLRGEPWRRPALARGLQSVISVPIQYEGVQYGVLTVYGDEPGALDSLSQSVMAELGDTVGNAMNAVETRHALQSDSVVELKLTVHDPDGPLSRLATETGAEIQVRGTVPKAGEQTRVFVTVRGVAADEFRAAATAAEDVEHVTLLEDADGDDDATRFELVVAGRTMPSTIVALGAAAERITVRDGASDVVVELPQSLSVRTFVDRLESTYSDTELNARRDKTRVDQASPSVQSVLTEGMTDRQREVLQTAYLSGYFEWPRERTGEEVAASLGITQSTFNNHLRTAERKLLARLFDARLPTSR